MTAGTSIELAPATADECRRLKGWPTLQPPPGYPDSLALCVIDAIWSMGVKYEGVINVVRRYGAWVTEQGWSTDRRSTGDLVTDIDAIGGPAAFADLVRNHSRTSTTNGVLKADAVRQAASALYTLCIRTPRICSRGTPSLASRPHGRT